MQRPLHRRDWTTGSPGFDAPIDARSRHELSGQRRARPERARDRRRRSAPDLSRSGTGGFPRWSRPSTRSACKPGDHLVTLLQNRWEAATIHWACQFAGIIVTPLNWRSTADELDYLPRQRRGQGAGLRGGRRPRRCAHRRGRAGAAADRGRACAPARSPSTRMLAADAPRRAAARRRRGLVGDALHLRHDRAAQGRAAPPARRARRGARPCGAEPLPHAASARSASCRSITPWACARCSRCR